MSAGRSRPQWDGASIGAVMAGSRKLDPPSIFMLMNVLKAENLVARRLARKALREILTPLVRQIAPRNDRGSRGFPREPRLT